MTRQQRRLYWIAVAVCLVDIALCAVAIHIHPDSELAPTAMGFCIAIGAYASRQLRMDAKPGVLA